MPHPVRRAYADLVDGQLHYRVAGDPQAPCLLLLHQSPSASVMYESLMARLADEFFLLAPDLPGFGQSDPLHGEVTIAAYARVVTDLLAFLAVDCCGVFGHHTGAAVALELAVTAPERVARLALSGPPLLSPEQQRSLPGRASLLPLSEDGAHVQALWQAIRARDAEADLSLSQRELLTALQCGSSYPDSYAAVAAYDFAAALAQVRCPALVFAGSEDSLHAGVAPALERLAQAETVTITGGGASYVCDRETGQVATALGAFFAAPAPS